MKRTALLASMLIALATGCSLDSGSGSSQEVTVVIGYQSKTINTVTAGTLLRAQGYLEKRLGDLTSRTGTKYTVQWQDYDTGAPITAQMLAEKIDIGSMGDYPLLINGSRLRPMRRRAPSWFQSRVTTLRVRSTWLWFPRIQRSLNCLS